MINGKQIVWGNILRALGAEQSYRRTIRTSVNSKQVARYIIEDPAFPRTISYCLSAISDSLTYLPYHEPVLEVVKKTKNNLLKTINYNDLGEPMIDFLNDIQLDLADIHVRISQNWFISQQG